MFNKRQTDFNHNLRKNVAINEKDILRKMASNFQNPKFNMIAKIYVKYFYY